MYTGHASREIDMKKFNYLTVATLTLFTLTFPYCLATAKAGSEHVFIGFLLNPVDGASYLAKMYSGWSGEWRFNLPYTAETSSGAYLFLFYIFLGHLARLLHLPLQVAFHIARLINSVLLMFILFLFYNRIFSSRKDMAFRAFLLASVGSGMGWVSVSSGTIPFDFFVAEAYPFLSMYVNPHFPAGLGLLLLGLIFLIEPLSYNRLIKLSVVGLAISVIYPFGQILFICLATGWIVIQWLDTRVLDWKGGFSSGFLGGLFLLYQFIAVQKDPLLKIWNFQNVTLTPDIWDVLLSLSPVLFFALAGGLQLIKKKGNSMRAFLLLWPIFGLIIAYLPVSFQRRFTFGIFIPLAALAVYGIEMITARFNRWGKLSMLLIFMFSLPSNIFLVASGIMAASTRSTQLYLTSDEYQTLSWIKENLPPETVILASPEISLLIPAFTGRRVVYAHPFETVDAEKLKQSVLEFYIEPEWSDRKSAFLTSNHVGYVLYGPRELKYNSRPDVSHLEPTKYINNVKLYSFSAIP